MEALLLIIGILALALMLGSGRSISPQQIILVQTEPVENGGFGCLPMLLIGIVLLVVLGSLQF
jgi:hypothetical protein